MSFNILLVRPRDGQAQEEPAPTSEHAWAVGVVDGSVPFAVLDLDRPDDEYLERLLDWLMPTARYYQRTSRSERRKAGKLWIGIDLLVVESWRCAGCRKELVADGVARETYAASGSTLGRKSYASLLFRCCSMQGRWQARALCRRKALDNISLCPGCNAWDTEPGKLCGRCVAAVAVGSSPTIEVQMCDDPMEGRDWGELRLAMAMAAKIPGTPVRERSRTRSTRHVGLGHEGPVITTTEEQADAVKILSDVVHDALAFQRREGRREGLNLLQRLADGTVSTNAFDAQVSRWRERAEGGTQ